MAKSVRNLKSKNKLPLPRRKSAAIAPYYRTHRKNTLKERTISMNNFDGGFIVRIEYFGKTTGVFKSGYYLIIGENASETGNVVAGGAEFDRYIHVFDIGYVPASVLNFLITLTRKKQLEEFIFYRTTFSYYPFPIFGRSLYNKLLPIMNKSYRKLIRDTKHIRRSYLIDYDFGKIRNAIKPKFVYPNIQEESLELQITARKYDLNEDQFMLSAARGKLVTLNPTIWSNLQNTESWKIGISQEQVRKNALLRGKDIETTNRIILGMKSSQTFYAPIIFKYKGEFYCVAGNTRLMTAMSLKVIPKVYIFSYIEE